MSECPYCQNTFEMNETCVDEFTMWQGLVGPYYFPYIDENGVLTWSNTGDLPNPDPVNIIGPPGAGLEFSGSAATVGDLPASANEYDIYIVGTSAPFYGYIYENGGWTSIGQVGRGEQGVSIVSVTKASGTGAPGTTDTYDVNLSDSTVAGQFTVYNGEDGQGSPGSSTPLADTTGGAVGTAVAYSREDHQHPLNVATSGTPSADGTADLGSAATYAKTDHVHPLNVATSGTPVMDGTAALGSASTYARSDHVHPTDTSRQETLVSGTNIKTVGGQSLLGSGNVEAGGALYFTSVAVAATTGDIVTVSNAAITADHVLAECVFANPSAITTEVTWTTTSGNLALNGTCSSATTCNIVLVKKNN